MAPGILSEKIFPTAVDVTGREHGEPKGDGSPLEEGSHLRWRPMRELLELCRSGAVPDAKTEIVHPATARRAAVTRVDGGWMEREGRGRVRASPRTEVR